MAKSASLTINYLDDSRFHVDVDMIVDFHGWTGDDADPAMRVRATADVTYTGLIVVPGNLDPKPTGLEEVTRVAAEFAELNGYETPEQQGFRYLLRPNIGG